MYSCATDLRMTKYCSLKHLCSAILSQTGVTFMFKYKIFLYFVY